MPKRTLNGVVVSDKQDKTVIVKVERRYTHLGQSGAARKYYAHDENTNSRWATWSGSRRRPLSN
jgi:small subunit ribosomal protein S17